MSCLIILLASGVQKVSNKASKTFSASCSVLIIFVGSILTGSLFKVIKVLKLFKVRRRVRNKDGRGAETAFQG